MPQRTCIGCRKVHEKAALIRLVLDGGSIRPDLSGGKEGRGAYLCPSRECIKEAYKKKGSFSRALKCKIVLPDPEDLWLKMCGKAGPNN